MAIVKSYICAACKGSFEESWSEEERAAEYAKNFSSVPAEEPKEIVCDDCYQNIMEWQAEIINGQGTERPVGLLQYPQRAGTED